jgi:HEAT repeat protein
MFYVIAVLLLCIPLDCSSSAPSGTQEDSIPQIIENLKNGDKRSRAQAIKKVKVLGPKASAAIPVLLELLTNEDRKIRDEAAVALGRIGPAAVVHLCRALQDADERNRAGAAYALSFVDPKPTQAVPLLGRRLGTDASEGVRIGIISTLSDIQDKRAIPFLVHALKSDTDNYVRGQAAWGLGAFSDWTNEVAPPLIGALTIEPTEPGNSDIIGRAINSISLLDFAMLPQLLKAIKDPNFRGRAEALEAAGKFFRRISQEKRLAGKTDVVGDIKIAIPVLIDCLQDRNERIRLESIRALTEMEGQAKSSVPAIKGCLKDVCPSIRIAAAAALFSVDGNTDLGLPILIDALKDPNSKIRLRAIDELSNFGVHASPAVSKLVDSLQDEDTRFPAIYALEAIGPGAKDAIPALQKMIRKGSPSEAKAASQALQQISTTERPNK